MNLTSVQTELFCLQNADSHVASASNQALHPSQPILWNNLKFRSKSEVSIAEALEQHKVLFFPNCRCRLNLGLGRGNREPDFLVLHNGRWGILEVDGKDFHPASHVTEEHKRDRSFKRHGIAYIEHYDASDCYRQPDEVVRDFLSIISGGWAA